ncbi:hypothetical protein OH708_16850 [Pseudomonas capsici]|uniref:hypothetical protein n=1 Tax=Pseudomonas capsici TaxID=2810614 RepID=UPI0021808064|nr:hypothetical protein [Pseudomonas capsici]MCV4289589.1 hypothetical protein [Pseudomonas capsici]
MIQCSTSGTLDLEFGVLTHPGKQSFAFTASEVFQHRHESLKLAFAEKENPAEAGLDARPEPDNRLF